MPCGDTAIKKNPRHEIKVHQEIHTVIPGSLEGFPTPLPQHTHIKVGRKTTADYLEIDRVLSK
jgi:hypothetical protein